MKSKTSRHNKQNNQIVLYRRKYKAYIQEVRVSEIRARPEHKQETIRELLENNKTNGAKSTQDTRA